MVGICRKFSIIHLSWGRIDSASISRYCADLCVPVHIYLGEGGRLLKCKVMSFAVKPGDLGWNSCLPLPGCDI